MRKTLPKPGVKDDPVRAPAARAAFTTLKADVRAVASDQRRRLRRAMVAGRRWESAEFRDLVAGHPRDRPTGTLVPDFPYSPDGASMIGTRAEVSDALATLVATARSAAR
ncbi:DUF4132 domain-containing protein [Spirillospora sp. NPDC052242]